MSDERFKEIVDDITHRRVVKMSDEECNEIGWRYMVIPPNSASIALIFKRKNNK